ncbi:signal peptidase I, partial [Candidatus Shapirobacteria bacterium CG10_big_fil_rev_8_21_14_0_10_40_9]
MINKVNKANTPVKILGKIFEWVIFIALILVFLIAASPILPTKKYLSTYIVTSASMEPTIKAGALALVKKIGPFEIDKVKEGDIVTFASPENPNQLILHRVIKVDKDKEKGILNFGTKGDQSSAPDAWVVPNVYVRDRYILSIPYLGYLGAFMRTKIGFILVFGIPALLLLLLQIKKIKDGINEEVKKRTEKAISQTKEKKNTMTNVIILLFMVSAFVYYGTQQYVQALFTATASVSGVSIKAKDFVPPPVPTLLSPANDSYLNTTGLVMDWEDVSDYGDMNNPVYYIYQSANNPGFSPLAYESGHLSNSNIPAPGTPDGVYWWRVKACDSLNNCSPWSEVWKVTVDNIAPTTTVFIQGDLDETKDIAGNGGWHGYGWYESYDNVNLRITSGDMANDTIKYQILVGEVSCPAIGDASYSSGQPHDTNINSIVNALSEGVYSLCYYAADLAGNTESSPRRELLKRDNTNPSFTVDSVSGTNIGGVYYNSTNTVTVQISATDNLSGYTRARYDLYQADLSHNCTSFVDWNEDNLLPPQTSVSRTLTKSGLANGNYCFSIWVYDDVQNKSGVQTVKYTIEAVNPGDVVVNEVEYNTHQPDIDAAYEWFELYNNTSLPVTLSGWTITDNNATDTIPDLTIASKGFAVVAASSTGFATNYPDFSGTIVYILDGIIGNGLSNTGDRLVLKKADGVEIDAVSYGTDTYAFSPACPDVATGHSLSRSPAGHDTNIAADWIDIYSGSSPPGPNPGTNPHNEDGSLIVPTTTPEPSVTPTVTPTPTLTPTVTPELSSESSASPSATIVEPTPTPSPTPEASPTPTPSPSPEVSPTPTPEPSNTPKPTPTPAAEPPAAESPADEPPKEPQVEEPPQNQTPLP